MKWWRRGRVVQITALLILLLTALDLSGSVACALDGEDAPLLAAVGIAQPAPPSQDTQHIDDCFCCSHCVDLQSVALSLTPLAFTPTPVVPDTKAALPSGASLYHPPLI